METAWIAVIGSLGGVLVGGLLNVMLEQLRERRADRRWARDQWTHMHDRRRELAAQLPALLWELRSRAWSYADYRKSQPDWRRDIYVQAQQDRLEEASAAFKRSYFELAILGTSEALAKAALELLNWDQHLMNQAFRELPGPDAPNLELDDALWLKEINAFVDEAATDLGAPVRRPGRAPISRSGL